MVALGVLSGGGTIVLKGGARHPVRYRIRVEQDVPNSMKSAAGTLEGDEDRARQCI